MTITAHLVATNADEAASWYAKAFGAVEVSRIPLPGERPMAVELEIEGVSFHVASEFPQMGVLSARSVGGNPTVLQIDTADARALWQRAVAAGAAVAHPITETFWGQLHGQIDDPYGNRWNIAQKLRDVPPDEIAIAAAAIFAGA